MMKHVGGKAPVGAFAILIFFLVGCQKASNYEKNDNLPAPTNRSSHETREYPAVVMIVLPNGRGVCSGTFISEKAVLTAAHCAKEEGRYQVQASFGTFSTRTKIAFGPGVVNDPNDIALLIFDTAVASRELGQVLPVGDSVREGDTVRLVGYGCNNISSRTGAGTKRTGTNVVANITEYVEFLSPRESATVRSIIGPENRAGSCFGDSGGPALAETSSSIAVVAVTHAGGAFDDSQLSEYVDVANRADNRDFLRQMDTEYNLGIEGL